MARDPIDDLVDDDMKRKGPPDKRPFDLVLAKVQDDIEPVLPYITNIQQGMQALKKVGGVPVYGTDRHYTKIVDHLNKLKESKVTPMDQVKKKMGKAYGPMQLW